MESEKIVECINLEKKYFLFEKDYKIIPWLFTKKGCSEVRTPLTDINLTINKGDVIGFLGKNGAGKSTLMKIIAGITAHTGGGLKVNGVVNSLINLGAGFNPKYTGRQNIYYKGLLMGMSEADVDGIINEIIDFCEIGDYFDLPMYMYSSGMSARLGFALAIFAEHDILIVDEVFAVGDKLFREKSGKKMTELFQSGKSIIFASHSDEQIRQFCNRAIFIDDSRIVVDGTVEEAIEAYNKKYAPEKVQKPKTERDKFGGVASFMRFVWNKRIDRADLYRELAILHEEEGHLEYAYKYMLNACHLRPNGQILVEKLSSYKEILGEKVCSKYTVNPNEFTTIDPFLGMIRTNLNLEHADVCREIAFIHEREDNLELALKYMGYAKELRPSGPVIIQKYDEYATLLKSKKKI